MSTKDKLCCGDTGDNASWQGEGFTTRITCKPTQKRDSTCCIPTPPAHVQGSARRACIRKQKHSNRCYKANDTFQFTSTLPVTQTILKDVSWFLAIHRFNMEKSSPRSGYYQVRPVFPGFTWIQVGSAHDSYQRLNWAGRLRLATDFTQQKDLPFRNFVLYPVLVPVIYRSWLKSPFQSWHHSVWLGLAFKVQKPSPNGKGFWSQKRTRRHA